MRFRIQIPPGMLGHLPSKQQKPVYAGHSGNVG
nr:MAG TPA: hypothetical protein [Caudoviricetes sp.]